MFLTETCYYQEWDKHSVNGRIKMRLFFFSCPPMDDKYTPSWQQPEHRQPLKNKQNSILCWIKLEVYFFLWSAAYPLNYIYFKTKITLYFKMRSFRGHLVIRNSNLISAIDSPSKKTYEKTYFMPQSEIWWESYFFRSLWVTWGHLEVIWWL